MQLSVDLDVSREACVHLTSGILEPGTRIAFFKTVSNFPVRLLQSENTQAEAVYT